MSSLSHKILDTIEEKKITPLPRWHFLVKNAGLWSLSILFFCIGVFFMGIFFVIADHIEIFDFLTQNPFLLLSFGLFGIFFFWGGVSVIFLLFSRFVLASTKNGYKYSFAGVIIAVLCLQVVFGYGLSRIEVLKKNILPSKERLPFYQLTLQEKERIWTNPRKGFLAGKILSVLDQEIILADRKGKQWRILLSEDTKNPASFLLKENVKIRIEGRYIEPFVFSADIVFPFAGRRKNMQRNFENDHRNKPPFRERGGPPPERIK